MDGIIVLNKPKGLTSNDCVIKIKKALNQSKIGHTGTLDPNVCGVLPICIGKATKLVDTFMKDKKLYRCNICLGIKTETEDIYGNIIEKVNVDRINKVDEVLESFLGEYMQTPPMYSALKHNGKKLYEYARNGIEVEREKRLMHIYEIKRISDITYDNGCAYFSFDCLGSKGLYIRTLCTDIAKKLGTIGCMNDLIRLKTGNFSIEDSNSLDDIINNNFRLITIEEIFKNNPSINVSNYLSKMVNNGIYLDERQIITDEPFKVYYENKLIAIYTPIGENKYKPLIIF